MSTSPRFISKEELIECVKAQCYEEITPEFISSLTTQSGNTQSVERRAIAKLREIFNKLNLKFKEAGSQQSKDFRNIHDESCPNINFDLEVKKTDNNEIIFNDTCPNENIEYIILHTGKHYKTKDDIPPQIIWINGGIFIENATWLLEYKRIMEELKNKYGRGENGSRHMPGMIQVYPRPNYSANISTLIHNPTQEEHTDEEMIL